MSQPSELHRYFGVRPLVAGEWRQLAPPLCSATEAIQQGVAMLAALSPDDPPHIVVWHVEEPTLVLGRGGAVDIVDRLACESAGIAVTTRATGGGPLLWGAGLLAFDVLLPKGHALATTDVVESYRFVGDGVVAALAHFGIASRRLEALEARTAALDDTHPSARLCFGGKSPHEVVIGQRKIAGLSQARRATGTLIQGGILLTDEHLNIVNLVHDPTIDRASLQQRTASVASLGRLVVRADLTRVLFEQIARSA